MSDQNCVYFDKYFFDPLRKEGRRKPSDVLIDPLDPLVRIGDHELTRLFVAYPQYRDWLAKTHKATDTYWLWCKLLGRQPRCRLRRVINMLIDGRLEMPPGHARDELVTYVRRYVVQVTESIRKKLAKKELAIRRHAYVSSRTNPHYKFKYTATELYERGCRVWDEYNRGEIDVFERQRKLAEINALCRVEV